MLKTVEEMLGLNYQDAWVHGERRYSNSFKKTHASKCAVALSCPGQPLNGLGYGAWCLPS